VRLERKHPLLQRIDKILYSPPFFLLVGILTAASNIFALELFVYPCFILIAGYICLCARDLLPLMPLFVCGYITLSPRNNPAFNQTHIFSLEGTGKYIYAMLVPLVICLVYRLVTDPDFGGWKFLKKKRMLLPGMVILGLCYAISGLNSGQWATHGKQHLFMAFLQFIAITGLYYLFSGAVRWDLAPKAYLFWTGVCVGYVLVAELANIYITQDVIRDGTIIRDQINTGWGHCNNIGALFAMVIPLPFFLTGKGKYAWFAYVTAIVFYAGLVLTCSRGSIAVGTAIFVAGYVLSLAHSGHARRQYWIHGLCVLIPVLALVFLHEELQKLFWRMIARGLSSGERNEIYTEGIKQFKNFPIFGGSFFPVDYDIYVWAEESTGFTNIFPPRWHNTLVQLLATGGIVCLVGYLIHRVQTLWLFFRRCSIEKLFAFLSVLALLIVSMVDCHFFNVGPVLLYSSTLAFVEHRLVQKPLATESPQTE